MRGFVRCLGGLSIGGSLRGLGFILRFGVVFN